MILLNMTKFPLGDLGHRPHDYLAVGAIAPMKSAPMCPAADAIDVGIVGGEPAIMPDNNEQ